MFLKLTFGVFALGFTKRQTKKSCQTFGLLFEVKLFQRSLAFSPSGQNP
jgi:hypothetical protein